LPTSARVSAGHRLLVAFAGHDAACLARYAHGAETFIVYLGDRSHLDIPVMPADPTSLRS
ncbi:MAG: hypothetical protein ACRDPA_12240, partial [Solirubrobacteraceae bacterium]